MSGWGQFFGKLADQFGGRIERLKNERMRIIDEREILMSKPISISGARRVSAINDRISEINSILANNSKD